MKRRSMVKVHSHGIALDCQTYHLTIFGHECTIIARMCLDKRDEPSYRTRLLKFSVYLHDII